MSRLETCGAHSSALHYESEQLGGVVLASEIEMVWTQPRGLIDGVDQFVGNQNIPFASRRWCAWRKIRRVRNREFGYLSTHVRVLLHGQEILSRARAMEKTMEDRVDVARAPNILKPRVW